MVRVRVRLPASRRATSARLEVPATAATSAAAPIASLRPSRSKRITRHPSALATSSRALSGLTTTGVADGAQHRQVAGGVRIRPRGVHVDRVIGSELLHRLHLARPVDERPLEAPGVEAVSPHLIRGPDTARHAEHLGQAADHVIARCADDERRAPLVLVAPDLLEHLRVDPRQDPGHHLRGQPRKLDPRDPFEGLAGHPQQRIGLLVARSHQPVAKVIDPPPRQLAPRDEPMIAGGSREDHARRPGHQGLVEIEKSSARCVTGHPANGSENQACLGRRPGGEASVLIGT